MGEGGEEGGGHSRQFLECLKDTWLGVKINPFAAAAAGTKRHQRRKKKTISAAICVKQWSETATDVCKTLRVIKTMDVAFRLLESPVFTPEQISGCSTEMAKLRFQPRKERQAPVGQLCFFF